MRRHHFPGGSKMIVAVAIATLFVGCKGLRTVVEVPVYIHDTTIAVRVQHDSTYIDRWREVVTKGDTVYITNNQTAVKYITRCDTAYKVVEKPVTVTVSQIKEVERPLSWIQKTLIYEGVAATLAFLAVLAVRIIKKKYNLKKQQAL